MRLDTRMICTALAIAGCLGASACGKKEQGGSAVQMKDLEVVDGTTTDAMTDLDGVQSEAPAPAVPGMSAAGNSAGAIASAPANRTEPAGNAAAQGDAEVLSDQ
ncbi:hypothetical protein [Sphingobium mellinum]|uniref:hypothetical protein n=1 Tax=Sphingobium mellinum TaxID=1387166 RepID=UPI0030EC41C2